MIGSVCFLTSCLQNSVGNFGRGASIQLPFSAELMPIRGS